jgi:hypothetical protein
VPANVFIALAGLVGMVLCLIWETVGLGAAADFLAGGSVLPAPYDAFAGRVYDFLRDWQVLLLAGLLVWRIRAPVAPSSRPMSSDPSRAGLRHGSAARRLDAALRQLEVATDDVKLEIRNSVQESFMAFQVRHFLSLPAPGLESLLRDVGAFQPAVIYLFYRLLAKLEAVRAINIECTGQHIIAQADEIQAIMRHLRTAFQAEAVGELLAWPTEVTPPAAGPTRRARQETI